MIMKYLSKMMIAALPAIIGQSYASEVTSLQGYYKSKASISYSLQKVQQNKVDFILLDDALRLQPDSVPQSLRPLNEVLASSGYSDSQISQATSLYSALNTEPEEYVCVVNKGQNNTKIAFLVDDQSADCNQDPTSSSKAIASYSNTRKQYLTFYRQDIFTEGSLYYIETIEKDDDDSEAIITRFISNYPDQKTVELARIERNKTGSYMVEHFSDYGEPKGDTTGYRSYQWSNAPFREDGNASILSMTYLHGKNATFNGQADTPYFWVTKERVEGTNLPSGETIYFSSHVEQAQTTPANIANESAYKRFRYNADDKSSWLTYNFNNANKLNYLSPDECMVYAISNSESVVRYPGYFRTIDNCDEQPAGYERSELNQLTLDNDKTVSVTDPQLVRSAANIITAIENYTAQENNTLAITSDNMASMKARYDGALVKYNKAFSPVFWQ